MASSRPAGKIIQQDYDDLLATPSGSSLFCLSDRTWKMLIATTDYLHWATRYWSESGADIDAETIEEWATTVERELIVGSFGCGCACAPAGAITRWSLTGILQISYDNGETWSDWPEGDPRNTATRFAPMAGDDGDDKRCKAANNVLSEFKHAGDELIAQLTAVALVTDAAAAIADLFIPFGIPALPGLVLTLIASVFDLGTTVVTDALTDEQYGKFFCCVFDNVGADGQITQDVFDAIGECMGAEMETNAALILGAFALIVQAVGMNNIAQIPQGGTEDCDTCLSGICVDFSDPTKYVIESFYSGFADATVNSGQGNPAPSLQSGDGSDGVYPGGALQVRIPLPAGPHTVTAVSFDFWYEENQGGDLASVRRVKMLNGSSEVYNEYVSAAGSQDTWQAMNSWTGLPVANVTDVVIECNLTYPGLTLIMRVDNICISW